MNSSVTRGIENVDCPECLKKIESMKNWKPTAGVNFTGVKK